MQKTILITGSTDGIGLETAKTLVSQGHHVLIHGRNAEKLKDAEKTLIRINEESVNNGSVDCYLCDLSRIPNVIELAEAITKTHKKLDVLINNAGVYKTPKPITVDGLDARFAVNTIAPYLLTQKLLPHLGSDARVINLSSAAQAPVNIKALIGEVKLSDDLEAYSQSKLAITMWTRTMALSHKEKGPVFIAVNPGSLLATKMVKEGFGMAGHDIRIGADILIRLALDNEFADVSGQYFDNDYGKLASPHKDALDDKKAEQVVSAIESVF